MLCFNFSKVQADNDEDSLRNLINKYERQEKTDTVLANLYLKLHYVIRMKQPQQAINLLLRAKVLYEATNDKIKIAAIYNRIGNIYFEQQMYYLALENFFKGYDIIKQQDGDNDGSLAYSISDIANTYFAQDYYDIAYNYYKEIEVMFKKTKDNHGLALAYNNMALVKRNTGQLDSALYYFNKALDIRKKIKINYLIAHSYNYLGRIYMMKNDFEKALGYYNEVLNMTKDYKIKNTDIKSLIAEAYFYIGEINFTRNKINIAMEYYYNSRQIYEEIYDYIMFIKLSNAIAKLYILQNKFEEAGIVLNNALKIENQYNYLNEKLKTIVLLLDVHFNTKNYTLANYFMKKYVSLTDSILDINLNKKLSEVRVALETYQKQKENELLKQKNKNDRNTMLLILLSFSILIGFLTYIYLNRRRSEHRIHQLSDASYEGIFIHDKKGILDCNKQFEILTGYSLPELKKMTPWLLIPKDYHNIIQDSVGQNHSFEIELKTKKGELKFVEYSGQPFEYKRKEARVIAVKDITERKKQEQDLLRYTEELKELNATKDKFFSIIAHDLKNPFHGILGLAELLVEDYNIKTKEQMAEYSKLILNAAKKGYNLLENLLEWSRSKTGRIIVNKKHLNLNNIIIDIIALHENLARQKAIHIAINSEKEYFVFADENMLRTILRNLISNAIKFTDIKGNININAKEFDNYIELEVKDNGIGMSSEDINLLFRIDATVVGTGTSGEKGTGLGLILCKEFVEINGGTIRVISESGKGSSFIFTIPKK